MRKTAIGQFRMMGFIEGASLLILLFIAMPLKYWAGIPEAVRIVGSLHGLFFILYILMIVYTTYKVRWSFIWVVSAFAVAFIPFGNIILDRFLQRTFSVKEV
jgi:integral membrane protein